MKAKFWVIRDDGTETPRFDSIQELYNNVMAGDVVAEVTDYDVDDELLLFSDGKLCCPLTRLTDIVAHLSTLCPVCSKEDDQILEETINDFYEWGGPQDPYREPS